MLPGADALLAAFGLVNVIAVVVLAGAVLAGKTWVRDRIPAACWASPRPAWWWR